MNNPDTQEAAVEAIVTSLDTRKPFHGKLLCPTPEICKHFMKPTPEMVEAKQYITALLVQAKIDELIQLTGNTDMTPEWLINRIAKLQSQLTKDSTK